MKPWDERKNPVPTTASVSIGLPAMGQTASRPVTERIGRSPRRWILAALGVICVGLAAAGLVVPGLPTTVFLIAASYLFTRSCPWLEERLVRHRMFRAYAAYLDGSCPMPRRARWTALILMWSAVTTSLVLLAARGALEAWLAGTIVAAALAGSAFILMYRRSAPCR
jgi:uncharacterized membrane protein YbaN (DUF454 family)